MSYQTKEQSIGYILKGLLNSELPADQIIDVVRLSYICVEDRTDITKEDTLQYWNEISKKLILTEEIIVQVKSEIYYLFDTKTIEQAEDYFEGFTILYPFLTTINNKKA